MQNLHRGQQPVLTVGRGNAPLLVAGATSFPPTGGLYSSLCVSFILPPEQGEVRRSRKGGGERSEPVSRIVFMFYDTESKSRNADFISIAREGNPPPFESSEPFEPYEPSCAHSA